MGCQLSVSGLYRPPVPSHVFVEPLPPQTSISLPVQMAECTNRGSGASRICVGVQLSETGSYWPPELKRPADAPPQMIIRVPVQIAVWPARFSGAPTVEVASQVSVAGS